VKSGGGSSFETKKKKKYFFHTMLLFLIVIIKCFDFVACEEKKNVIYLTDRSCRFFFQICLDEYVGGSNCEDFLFEVPLNDCLYNNQALKHFSKSNANDICWSKKIKTNSTHNN